MSIQIDIIIPTFNRAHLLPRALKSALNQDYENIKIIVANNNSEDNTDEIITKFLLNDKSGKLSYIKNPENVGMVNNWRNVLFNYCNGDYFLILNDDDYLIDSSYISKVVSLINDYGELMLVYSQGYVFDTELNKVFYLDLPFNTIESGTNVLLQRNNVFPQDFTLCNVVFNEIKSKELNCFSNPFNVCCDSELFFKICLLGNVGVIHDYVSVYNFHSQNLVKEIPNNLDLKLNGLDSFIEPYVFAKENNFLDSEDLEILKEKVKSEFLVNSVDLMCDFPDDSDYAIYILKSKCMECFNEIRNNFIFKISFIFYKFNLMKLVSFFLVLHRKRLYKNFSKKGIPINEFKEKNKINI